MSRGCSLALNGLGLHPSRQKNRAPRGTGIPAVGIMGKMAMLRQATTESFSFSPLRPCAFALPFSSLFPSAAFAGYPPKTEAIPPAHRVRLYFRGKLWMNPLFEKPG